MNYSIGRESVCVDRCPCGVVAAAAAAKTIIKMQFPVPIFCEQTTNATILVTVN